MDNQNSAASNPEAMGKNIVGETVQVELGSINSVNAVNMTMRQAAAQNVTTSHLVVRQGGLGKVKAENMEITQGGVAFAQVDSATLKASQSGVVVAGSEVTLDQSSAKVLVAGGNVKIDQSATAVMVGNTVQVQNSPVVFLFAKHVEGEVKPAFGPQESIIFGASAGMVAGVVMLLAGFFKRKKKR